MTQHYIICYTIDRSMENLSPKFLKRVGDGKFVTKRGKTKKPRRRTMITYQNKLTKLKHQYIKLSKSEKFKSKFPTEKSFLDKYKLKEVTK